MLNLGWPAPQLLPEKATTLQRFVPAVTVATSAEFERAAEWMASYQLGPTEFLKKRTGTQHVSDQALMSKATKLGVFDKEDVAAPYTGDAGGVWHRPLIHFSHNAVAKRGGGRERNELMRAALDGLLAQEKGGGEEAGKSKAGKAKRTQRGAL